MTRSNRIGNRVLLALVALVAIAGGAFVLLPVLGFVASWDIPEPSDTSLWIALAGCVVVIVLSLVWMFSRGRGRTGHILELTDDGGAITIDSRVAADLIAEALSANPDVVSVGSGSYLMRGSRVLSLRLVARKGVNLPTLIGSVGATMEQLDAVLGRRVPVLLQIVGGVRASVAREVRVR